MADTGDSKAESAAVALLRQDILLKIRAIAERDGGAAPGRLKFATETGIKEHHWRGRIWRRWNDAIVEAGLVPNERQAPFADADLLEVVRQIAKRLGRFPTSTDIAFEGHRMADIPNTKTIAARWKMGALADALAAYAEGCGDSEVAQFARNYVAPPSREAKPDAAGAVGYVYMQRHGTDYKIGFTTSLNKRGRQIQLELPQETELLHSILTDDPTGVEAYWHRRFASQRTRGEWFRLTKADIAAFKRWSKIW